MKMQREETSLAEELPYWDFGSEPRAHAILIDGSLVGGVRVKLADIESFDDGEITQFTIGLRTALNSISEGVTLQMVLSVRSDYSEMLNKHSAGKSGEIHPIVRSIAEHREHVLDSAMKSGELYRPQLLVYIRAPMVSKQKMSAFKKRAAFSEDARKGYSETLEILGQNLDTLCSSFNSLGLDCTALNKSDILANIYEFLNPKRAVSQPAPALKAVEPEIAREKSPETAWLAPHSPREQLVFGDLILDFEQFTLDNHYHRVVTLKTLPETTFAGQLSTFLRMPFHYDLILSLEVPAQSAEMAKLQQKRKMAHSLAATQGGRASDLESESKLSSTEELIWELLNTGQRIYAVQMSVVLREPASPKGAKKLNRHVRDVLSRFRGLQGAEALEESVGAWKVLKQALPAAPMTLERARKMKTNNLADFLPVYGPLEGDKDPVVVLRNRMNGLVAYNGFDSGLSNYNILVTGSSGAGKSFLNNCVLLQELARGLRVFIIDIGGSYKKLTEALDGQYLEVNLSEQYRLNPFDIPDPGAEPSTQKVKSLLAVIESMVTDDDKAKLPKLDRVLLEKAIIDLFARKRAGLQIPTLSDLMNDLAESSEPSLNAISKMLYIWTGDRPYGRLLDGQGSLRSEAPICTFDLKGLSSYPDLQSVMILILTDFILAQVERDKSTKKRIILDEAWALLKSNAAASFMEYCARTLRKTGSGITFITQGLEEIVASPIGAPILNNTATKIVMLQRGDPEVLRETLKLNSRKLALLHSLGQKKGEFSEALLIKGDSCQVVRITPIPTEYWLSTSDARDNELIEKLQLEGLSLAAAIERAATIYPNGIASGRKEAA